MSETNTSAKKTTWQDWATRTTAILAVIAALSSGRWGASNLQAILEQGKVNDTWAYFQADSIKERNARQMKGLADAMSKGNVTDEQAKALSKLNNTLIDEEVQKGNDKQARYNDARKYEKSRDNMVETGFWYEVSFALLQLGVILCTIATAAKSKGPFFGAIVIGVVGFSLLVNGYHRFVHAPQRWYQNVSEKMGYEGSSQTSGK